MKKQRLLLMLVPLLLMAALVSAQKRTITGKVLDATNGTPLAGVSILANKGTAGIASKEDGTFSINLNGNTKSIMFSYVGFTNQIVQINNDTTLTVSLKPETGIQSEVVVIGYGSQKRSSVSGAVAKFKNDKLDEVPVSRVDQALQGKIAGVSIQNISSEAGAEPKINIRGVTSINAGSNPLVVIDGQITPDGLGFINPADVESIEVLKDAASAAIYGSRGSSGVILVTTKKGSADKPKYNFKYSVGQRKAYKTYDVMNTSEYVGMLFTEMANKATDPTVNQTTNTVAANDRASYILENQILNGNATNWQNESLRSAMTNNIQLGVSGGTKSMRYYISGGYQGEEGLMRKAILKIQRKGKDGY